jgi:hypothetical protein
MRPVYDALLEIIDPVSEKHLNQEYQVLCHKLAAALCRKRPSPLARGSHAVWAAGIVHAIGLVNFLFDKSKKPYISSSDLSDLFGVSQSTIAGKSKQIRDLFKMGYFDHTWTVPSNFDSFPIWTITVNGMIVDARSMPLQIQLNAFAKGLIPYVPALKDLKGNEPKSSE